MLKHILNPSLRDGVSSSAREELSDEISKLPRTTDLLLKLKTRDRRVRWGFIIPGIIYVAIGSMHMAAKGGSGESGLGWDVYIWYCLAFVFFVGEGWQRQRERQETTVELLAALVAQNNELRRELEKLSPPKTSMALD